MVIEQLEKKYLYYLIVRLVKLPGYSSTFVQVGIDRVDPPPPFSVNDSNLILVTIIIIRIRIKSLN